MGRARARGPRHRLLRERVLRLLGRSLDDLAVAHGALDRRRNTARGDREASARPASQSSEESRRGPPRPPQTRRLLALPPRPHHAGKNNKTGLTKKETPSQTPSRHHFFPWNNP